ncbi:unnamed protein product, partial [Darwinula stevensoni]
MNSSLFLLCIFSSTFHFSHSHVLFRDEIPPEPGVNPTSPLHIVDMGTVTRNATNGRKKPSVENINIPSCPCLNDNCTCLESFNNDTDDRNNDRNITETCLESTSTRGKYCYEPLEVGPCLEGYRLELIKVQKLNKERNTTEMVDELKCKPLSCIIGSVKLSDGTCLVVKPDADGRCPPGWYNTKNTTGIDRCDCEFYRVYSPTDGQCHKLYTQGPCGEGKVLVANGDTNTIECQERKCPDEWVFFQQEKCYQLRHQGPCNGGIFMLDLTTLQPSCFYPTTVFNFIPPPKRPCPMDSPPDHNISHRVPVQASTFPTMNRSTAAKTKSHQDASGLHLDSGEISPDGKAFWPKDGQVSSLKYCYEPLEVGPCPEGYRLELTEVQKVNEERNTTETVEDLRCKALPCPNGSEKLSDGTCAVKPNGEGHCPLGWYPLEDNSGIVGCECEFYRVYVPSDGQCHKLYTQGPCGEGKVLVVNGDRKTIECQKRTCPDEWAYWPDHERCYPLRQEGPCNGGIFMLDLTTLQPFCADPITALAFITAKDRPCQPGSFRDFNIVSNVLKECTWTKQGKQQVEIGSLDINHISVTIPDPIKMMQVNMKNLPNDANQTSPLKMVDTEKARRNETNEGGMNPSGENIDIPSCPCPNDNCTCVDSLNNCTDDRNIIETCMDSTSTRRKCCYEPLGVEPCPEGYRLELTEVQKLNKERNTTETVEELRCKALPCPMGSVKLSDGTCVIKMNGFLFLLPFVFSALHFSLSCFVFPHKISPEYTDVNPTSPSKLVDTEKAKRNATSGEGIKPSGQKIDIPSCPSRNDNCSGLESFDNTGDRNITETCLESTSTRRKYCYEPLEVGPCPEGYRLELTEVQKLNKERNTTETVEELRCKALPCPKSSVKLSDGTCVVKPNEKGDCPPGWYPSKSHSGIVECECEYDKVYSPSDGQCHKLYTQGPCGEGKVLVANGDTNTIECQERKCPDEWVFFPQQEKCYQLRHQGPCDGKIFMLDLTTLQPFCSYPTIVFNFITAKNKPCQPGSFHGYN